jgi:hypothetical protein
VGSDAGGTAVVKGRDRHEPLIEVGSLIKHLTDAAGKGVEACRTEGEGEFFLVDVLITIGLVKVTELAEGKGMLT